jgi:hypothetical protein
MDGHARRCSLERAVVVAAIAVGLAAGTYGVANAASGSSSGSGSSGSGSAAQTPNARQPWGGQRSDETLLSGDTAAKVKQAALARVSGGTVVRIETDADGNAAYEAHMVKADGTPVTVYVNRQFQVVSVESGMPGRSHSRSSGTSA